MLKAGAKAPSFSLDDMSGRKRSLADVLERGPALLVFYKISCPVCQMSLPYVDRLAPGSLNIIAISQDDESATTKFQEKFGGANLETLLDRAGENYPASNAYGIAHVPSMFFVEPDGTISAALEGFSKREMESIGRRAGVEPFRPDENVPEWRAG